MSVVPLVQKGHKISCLCQYLCDKPNGEEYCHLVGEDWASCQYHDDRLRIYISPSEIICEDKCKCQYTGKRESCKLLKGHETCGVSVNGHIPEGEIPKDLVEKIKRIIPTCNAI